MRIQRFTATPNRVFTFSALLLGVLWMLIPLMSSAAEQSAANSASAPVFYTGTIERLDQDNGFIIVSGRRLAFDDEYTRIYYEHEPLRPEQLLVGMVVRYTLLTSGGTSGTRVLRRINVLGPADMMRQYLSR